GPPPAGDRVGLEPGPVVDVDDGDLLVLEDVGRLEQVGIDGDGADVVQVGRRDHGTVDLRLQHAAPHGLTSLGWVPFTRSPPRRRWAWMCRRYQRRAPADSRRADLAR